MTRPEPAGARGRGKGAGLAVAIDRHLHEDLGGQRDAFFDVLRLLVELFAELVDGDASLWRKHRGSYREQGGSLPPASISKSPCPLPLPSTQIQRPLRAGALQAAALSVLTTVRWGRAEEAGPPGGTVACGWQSRAWNRGPQGSRARPLRPSTGSRPPAPSPPRSRALHLTQDGA